MAAHGLDDAVKLASNESPFGPLPGVLEAVTAATERGRDAIRITWPNAARARWPSGTASSPTTSPSAAARSACSSSSSSPTPGRATRSCSRGRRSWPTRSSRCCPGPPVIEAPLRDWAADVEALLAAGHAPDDVPS